MGYHALKLIDTGIDSMERKTGVLLIQLGTPKKPTVSAVRPYLREFLSDPRVIDIPALLRYILVYCIIAPFRAPKSTKIYKELWSEAGGSSPLMTHTVALTEELNKNLKEDTPLKNNFFK